MHCNLHLRVTVYLMYRLTNQRPCIYACHTANDQIEKQTWKFGKQPSELLSLPWGKLKQSQSVTNYPRLIDDKIKRASKIRNSHKLGTKVPLIMSQPSPQHDPITPEKIEPLASGLWGSVFRITGTDTVVKVAKDVKTGLHFGEKRIYERLGDHPLITQYLGETMVQVEGEKKPGLLCRYYPLGTIKAFFKSPGSSEVCNLQSQQLRYVIRLSVKWFLTCEIDGLRKSLMRWHISTHAILSMEMLGFTTSWLPMIMA